ncbi:MAG: hypothetical protein ACREF7_00315 [Candidatus Saccharimonadales bacterium]
MIYRLALLAAVGVALCNGVAAVLEKISADKQIGASFLRIRFLTKLIRDWPYLVGLLLDIIAWPLTLVAVHTLPLFVVQPIVAISVVVTVVIDKVILHRALSGRTLAAIGIIFVGLVMLSLSAQSQKAHLVNQGVKWLIVFFPLLLAGLGTVCVKLKRHSATVMAGISGLAFGGTAITGRMLVFTHPYWHVLYSPLLWSLFAYGLVGILTFTVALQRHHASVINATMVAFETLVPITIGITILGDSPRQDQWLLVGIGVVLALIGTILISFSSDQQTAQA